MTNPLQTQLDNGVQLLRSGRLDEARKLADTLVQQYPDSPESHFYAADAAALDGDHRSAIAYLEKPSLPGAGGARILLRIAQLQFGGRQREAALETAYKAAKVIKNDERQLRAVARLLSDCQDLEGARKWLLDAHRNLPKSPLILFDLAVSEFHLNKPDEAEEHIESLLELSPFHPGALHLRSALRTQTTEKNHVADLEDRLARGPDNPNLLTAAYYAMAKDYEDLSQYQESFIALNRGAQAYRSTLNYNSAQELAAHEDIRAGFTPEAFSSLSGGCEEDGAIFILGMPRTGTTLVERLLGSHSQVSSIGEFRDFPALLRDLTGRLDPAIAGDLSDVEASLAVDFGELGKRYMSAARQLAPDSAFFVDKLPFNFLYCGYIAAALPRAKLIHLTRDPLDTCYAMYKTLFFGAYSYSYELTELADYYISYRKQMEHWHQLMPGRILDVKYEELVKDPDTQSRRILEWCALPWEEAVLEFHAQQSPSMTASAMQVRNPVHTDSIGSWQRAGSGMDVVRERLLQAGIIET